jgi:hypothetical protein
VGRTAHEDLSVVPRGRVQVHELNARLHRGGRDARSCARVTASRDVAVVEVDALAEVRPQQ